jgi:hypothetical protein
VRWHIDPTGTSYENRGRGEVKPPNPSGRRDAQAWLSEILARQATHGDQNYHALHDGVGHALARAVREENDDYFGHLLDPHWRDRAYDSRSPHFQRQEHRATRRAEALARWLGEDFAYPAERGY